MPNFGNTGQHYKFRHIQKAEVTPRGGVMVTLNCGHTEDWNRSTPWTQASADQLIGQRIACHACGKQST